MVTINASNFFVPTKTKTKGKYTPGDDGVGQDPFVVAPLSTPIFDLPSATSPGFVQESVWDDWQANATNFDNLLTPPKRTSVADAFKTIQGTGILPKYSPVSYTDTTFKGTNFNPITGLGENYYDNILNQAQKRLQENYFGNSDSLQKRLNQQMNQRGLIGSGIEQGGTQDLYKSFGSDLTDVLSQISQQRSLNDLDLNKFNTQGELENQRFNTQAELENQRFNTGNRLQTDFQNKDLQNQLAQLGLAAAGDEAKTATDFDTKMYASDIDLETAKANQIASGYDSLTNLISSPQFNDEVTRKNAVEDILRYIASITG